MRLAIAGLGAVVLAVVASWGIYSASQPAANGGPIPTVSYGSR